MKYLDLESITFVIHGSLVQLFCEAKFLPGSCDNQSNNHLFLTAYSEIMLDWYPDVYREMELLVGYPVNMIGRTFIRLKLC